MFWLAVGFLLTSFGLSMLAFFADDPDLDRDPYARNAGAGGGFLAFLGLITIFLGAQTSRELAVPTLVLSLLVGATGAWIQRKRRRSKERALLRRERGRKLRR
ncbi:MAG TPA: hypothetical protein VGE01_00360, partial [Fimbriimonas sp.]